MSFVRLPFNTAAYGVFAQVGEFLVQFFLQPLHELLYAVGVIQPGQRNRLLGQLIAGGFPDPQRAAHHIHVNRHATGVYQYIRMPLLFKLWRHGEVFQPVQYFHFGGNVPDAVFFEQRPFRWIVARVVASAPAVGLCRAQGTQK